MRRSSRPLAVALALVLGPLACERAPPPPPPPLRVEIAGCAAVRRGPVCEIEARADLRVWVEAPERATVTIEVNGAPSAATAEPLAGGRRFRLQVTGAARALLVRAADGTAVSTKSILIEPILSVPALDEAEALRHKGKLDEADARLDTLRDDPRPLVQLAVLRKRARIERARGQEDSSASLLGQAIDTDRALGRVSDEAHDRFALFYVHMYGAIRRFTEARRALDDLDGLERDFPEARVMALYYRALLARETGALRGAVRLLEECVEAAARLGFEAQRADALEMSAVLFARLGRHDEALAASDQARRALAPGAPACRRGQSENNHGWVLLLAAQGGRASADPLSPLAAARDLQREGQCPPADLAHTWTNLGLAALADGRIPEARAHLGEARRAMPRPDPRLETYAALLEARAAEAEGRPPGAQRAFEKAAAIARAARAPEARFEALLGRARALEAQRKAEDARAAYAEADAALDALLRGVPLGEGRETFLPGREEVTRLRVGFLLEQARTATGDRRDALWKEAAGAALRGKSRLLRAVGCAEASSEARDRAVARYREARARFESEAATLWRLPDDRRRVELDAREGEARRLDGLLEEALAALCPPRPAGPDLAGDPPLPAPGELLLVHLPVRDGLAAMAITERGIDARLLGSPREGAPPDQLASSLLAPFGDAIRGAQRIRLVTLGWLAKVDVGALPFEGEPLASRIPVVYGQGLAGPGAPAAGEPRRALVVADPRGDLPGARREARTVAAALAREGFSVRLLLGEEATHGAVVAALSDPATRLFHQAGHGSHAGRDGLESVLALAGAGALSVGDVLSLPRAPEVVVLSGCETGVAGAGGGAEGLGLGQAFVVAGARAVLAAVRSIPDLETERWMSALYGAEASPLDPARGLHRAQRAARSAGGAEAMSAFRVLAP